MDNENMLITADMARENVRKYYDEDRANELYIKAVAEINDAIKTASYRGERRVGINIGVLNSTNIEKGILLVDNLKENGFSIDIMCQGDAILISW